MKSALALLGLVCSLALVAAGCGGDDSASATDEWAESFCTSITTWRGEISQATDELTDLSSLSVDSFQSAAEDARAATSDLMDELRALGAPETSSGEEAKQAFDDFTTTADEERADIEDAVQGVSSATDLPGAFQTITAAVANVNEAFMSMLETVRSGDAADELETSFENADACDDLR
jgi:hypothetical protein